MFNPLLVFSTTTLHTTSPLSSTTSASIPVSHSSSPSHTSPNTSLVQSLTPLQFSTSNSPSPVPSTDPDLVLFLTTNTHPMITRSKNGITMPKLCYKVVLDYYTELASYKIAFQYPQWTKAMDEKFSTLQRQKT